MTPACADLYAILLRLATRDLECPTNRELADELAVAKTAVAGRLAVLVEQGHVSVRIFGRGRRMRRQVTITATGQSTAQPDDLDPTPPRSATAEPRPVWIDTRPPRVPEVTSCFYCGTRSDIGCRHSRRGLR